MEITEVKLTRVRGDDKLKAFVSITFDNAFVVRDLKIIKGKKGEFVAMPSRKLTEHCPKCGRKNSIYSAFCNTCGNKLPRTGGEETFKKIYADIAHPINAECRTMIQERVLEEYRNLPEEAESGGNPYDAGPITDEGDYVEADDRAGGSRDRETDSADSAKTEKRGNATDGFSDGIW